MSKINAFRRVLNQQVKTCFFMDFQLIDNLNISFIGGGNMSTRRKPPPVACH
jgi:hypothetical protein